MQPKVSQEVLDDIRVAALHPPIPPHDNLWSVSINVNTGEGYSFSFVNQVDAERFFETLKPKVVEPLATAEVAAGPRMYSHEEVKGIVEAAVTPVVDPVPPPSGVAGIWQRLKANWKVASLVVSLVASLTSNFLTLKVVLGPVKVPDIVITLPDGTSVPPAAVKVETQYKLPVTNGLRD